MGQNHLFWSCGALTPSHPSLAGRKPRRHRDAPGNRRPRQTACRLPSRWLPSDVRNDFPLHQIRATPFPCLEVSGSRNQEPIATPCGDVTVVWVCGVQGRAAMRRPYKVRWIIRVRGASSRSAASRTPPAASGPRPRHTPSPCPRRPWRAGRRCTWSSRS